MNLLDRLRGQPKWQHEDPSVRVSAVDGLEDDAQDLFLAIATEDADPGVRAAAVARLTDPAALALVVRADSDPRVRTEAATMLLDVAIDATDPAPAEVALSGLSEPRDLGDVARTARIEAISLAALGRIDAQKTISSVSRRSEHAAVRAAALARISDQAELLAVAVKSDHRDIALAALERLLSGGEAARGPLKTVAMRARVKSVARRAKAAIAALDAEPADPPLEDPRRQRERLCENVEALAGADDWNLVSRGLDDAAHQWDAIEALLQHPAPTAAPDDATGPEGNADADADAALSARWSEAVAQIRTHLSRLDAARRDAERDRQQRAEALAARSSVCDQLAAKVDDALVDVGGLAAEVARARAEWAALPPAPDGAAGTEPSDRFDECAQDELSRSTQRFEELVGRAEGAMQRQQSAAERLARLTTLVAALEEVAASAPVGDLKRRWTGPHAEWREMGGDAAPEPVGELAQRVAAAEAVRAERLAGAREERQRREQATLARRRRRCDELERAVADENLELNEAERHLRTTRSLLGNLGRLPTRDDRDALTARLRAVQVGFVGRVRELRGLAEWKQWANLGVQAALCQRLEALASVDDEAVVAEEYRQIMLSWRQASEVQRGEGDEVFLRFKAAHDAIRPKAAAYLARQEVHRQECLDQKVTLCEEAERLAVSTDWIATAQRMTELQAAWKQIGPATRKQEREVWNRFRAASGQFFKRRREDLVQRKQVWAQNAELKDELCRKAEALSEEKDIAAAKERVRQLQAEWKGVGPVRRNRSEAMWTRFRAACDAVYARQPPQVAAEFAEKVAARLAVCERLEALLPAPAREPGSEQTEAAAADDLAGQVAAARTEWRQLPPAPHPQQRSLSARFQAALSQIVDRCPDAFSGTDLDPQRNLATLARLCERLEALLGAAAPGVADARSPAEVLAERLREALASNTMGARVDPEAQRRADMEEVKRLQAERRAIGVVPGETGRALSNRFHAACDRFFQQQPPAPERPPRPTGESRSGRGRPGSRQDSGSRRRA